MQNPIFLFLTAAMLHFVSCDAPQPLTTEYLESDRHIEYIADSIYLVRAQLHYQDNKLYVADYELNQVFILDDNNPHVEILGKQGRGPGDLLGPGQFYVSGDTLLVYNDGKSTIETFVQGIYQQTINLPRQTYHYSGARFFMKDQHIYLSSPSEQHSIAVFAAGSDEDARTMGDITKGISARQTRLINDWHLLPYDQYIVSVGSYLPVINIYDHAGNLESHLDIGNLPILEERMKLAAENNTENSFYIIIQDVCLFEDTLYLLVINNEGEKYFTNKVLVCDLSSGTPHVTGIYDLGQGHFSSIASSGSHLWAFQSSKGNSYLERFPISRFSD